MGETHELRTADTQSSLSRRYSTEHIGQLNKEHPEATVTADIPETAVAETQPRIETALWEILDNAAQHAGADPTIDILVEKGDEYILIRICDDGPGLPSSEQQVLTTGEESPLAHGKGLGLFLTHWIITTLEGDISVTIGDGTAVEIQIPIPAAATARNRHAN